MKSAVFTSPIGETHVAPDESAVKLLLDAGEDYWQDQFGCGHGTFDAVEDRRRKATLEVTFKQGVGFYLLVVDRHASVHRHFLAVNQSRGEEIAVLHYGGEPFLVPIAFLHPKDVALSVILEFCATGCKSECVEWYPRKALGWDSTTGIWTPPTT